MKIKVCMAAALCLLANSAQASEWKPTKEFLARPIVTSQSAEPIETGLTVGELAVYCRKWLYGKASFERHPETVFRCSVRNELVRKTEVIAFVYRDAIFKGRNAMLVTLASNPDGTFISDSEIHAGLKRIAGVFSEPHSVQAIHADDYHCMGTDDDLALPKFLRDRCINGSKLENEPHLKK